MTGVVLLGTGTPNPEPDRMGPATAVVVGGRAILVDAGVGVVRRAAAVSETDGRLSALRPERLDDILLTHLHVDHTAGLADALFTPWILGRPHPARVDGPAGTEVLVRHLLQAYEADRRARVDGPEPIDAAAFGARAADRRPGVWRDEPGLRIEAIEVRHGDTWDAFSFRFDTPDGTVVVSGDTTPFEPAMSRWAGADILVHEAYADAGLATRPAAWQAYHRSMHTSAHDVGRIASDLAVSTLVLTHVLTWDAPVSALGEEVRQGGFAGELVVGVDGTAIWLGDRT